MHEQINPNKDALNYKSMFRQLVKELHPDTGGDHDLMIELEKAEEDANNGNPEKLIEMYKVYIIKKNEVKIQNKEDNKGENLNTWA